MGQLKITINERSYDVACEDGQEQRLSDVATLLAGKVDQLVESVGQIGESRLLLMAGLLVADELYDVKAELEASGAGNQGGLSETEVNAQLGSLFDELSGRLEGMAQKLEARF